MAKAATKQTESVGSDKGELKKLLKHAADEPIHMAFAIGGDGKAIVKLDKMKQPRALEKALKDGAPDAKNIRFGTVAIDEDDPGVARFIVNKAVGGMARKLVVALKGTGFSKVQIVTEDGAAVEDAADEDDDATDDGAAPSRTGSADGAPSRSAAPDDAGGDDGADEDDGDEQESEDGLSADSDVEDGAARIDPDSQNAGTQASGQPDGQNASAQGSSSQGPSSQGSGQPDAATLTKQLTGLVKQMLGVISKDPTRKSALAELATDAQASLKQGDLGQAAAGIEVLRMALQNGDASGQAGGAGDGAAGASSSTPGSSQSAAPNPPQSATPNPPQSVAPSPPQSVAPSPPQSVAPSPPQSTAPDGKQAGDDAKATQKFQKSRAAWGATRAKVDSDLQKLRKAILSASEGDNTMHDLESQFMSAVAPVLETLDETLSDLLSRAAEANEGEREKLLQQARSTIDSHMKFVQGNKTISHLDENPFVPLSIGKTLTGTLATLSSIVR